MVRGRGSWCCSFCNYMFVYVFCSVTLEVGLTTCAVHEMQSMTLLTMHGFPYLNGCAVFSTTVDTAAQVLSRTQGYHYPYSMLLR